MDNHHSSIGKLSPDTNYKVFIATVHSSLKQIYFFLDPPRSIIFLLLGKCGELKSGS